MSLVFRLFLKKAVVKKLLKALCTSKGAPARNGAEFRIRGFYLKMATVMIDTTGSSLFKRDYRVDKGGAPIKEKYGSGHFTPVQLVSR